MPMNPTKTLAVQTAAAGANFAVPAVAWKCDAVRVHNNSGTPIEVRRQGDDAVYVPVQDKDFVTILGVVDAVNVAVRRIDQSNTQVNVVYEAINFS